MSENLQSRRPEEPKTYEENADKAVFMALAEAPYREEAIIQGKAAKILVQKYLEDGVNVKTRDLSSDELGRILRDKHIGGSITNDGGPQTFKQHIETQAAIKAATSTYDESEDILGAASYAETKRELNGHLAYKSSYEAAQEYDERSVSDSDDVKRP